METQSPKLLLIDDEAGLRRSLRFSLAQRGITIDDVEEGLPGLKLVESSFVKGEPYRCIIADIQLPDINGLKLLEVLKAKYPDLPIIVISAYGGETTADEVRARHGDAYLAKPFLADELVTLVDRIPVKEIEPKAEPATGVAHETVSTYALIKLRQTGDMVETFRTLYMMDNVVYCDAVNGDTDVVLLLNGDTHADIEKFLAARVRNLPDVVSAECLPIFKPTLEAGIKDFIREYNRQRTMSPSEEKFARSSTALSAYVFVEAESSRLSDVYPKLMFMDCVVSCDATHGSAQLVALVQARSVSELNRILTYEIGQIDGIVRTRTARIIHMFEM